MTMYSPSDNWDNFPRRCVVISGGYIIEVGRLFMLSLRLSEQGDIQKRVTADVEERKGLLPLR